jgi:hypothetical protein
MKTTNERDILEKEIDTQEERYLREKKEKFNQDTNYGEYLCGCDSGKCFECGI